MFDKDLLSVEDIGNCNPEGKVQKRKEEGRYILVPYPRVEGFLVQIVPERPGLTFTVIEDNVVHEEVIKEHHSYKDEERIHAKPEEGQAQFLFDEGFVQDIHKVETETEGAT